MSIFPGRKRILYVEDQPDTSELIGLMLDLSGYEVSFADTVTEGLKLARSGRFALTLLDQNLPDGTGVELCRRIRAFDQHTPILFFSAAARHEIGPPARAAAAQGCLNKTTDISVLTETVARLISEAEDAEQIEWNSDNSPADRTDKIRERE